MVDTVIDSEIYAEFLDTMGADFAVELVTTFLEEAPTMLAELRAAKEDDDADGFRRAAHSIKSNANIFGATQLAELALQSERNGPKPGAVAGIEAEFARVASALRELING